MRPPTQKVSKTIKDPIATQFIRESGHAEVGHKKPPSQLTCEKCGANDIYRLYQPEGSCWDHFTSSLTKLSPSFDSDLVLTVDHGWGKVYKAKRDLIKHHCRVCEFDWATKTLK